MLKIATHNSCTGERGYSWRRLFTLFSRCQGKTLVEQYDAGVRYFDIRVRKTKRGLVAAHGLWESAELLTTLLKRLDDHATEDYYLAVCYEGENPYSCDFITFTLAETLRHALPLYYAEKKPKWRVLVEYRRVAVQCCYKVMDFRSWHTWLPIPWLWKKLYYDKVEFHGEYYRMVDFV